VPTLQIREGHDTGRVFRLDEEVYLGCCPEGIDARVFLPLPDGEVSRRHARIFRKGNGYQIEDLGSTNGTRISDETLTPNQPRELKDGDEITISSTLLVYRDKETSVIMNTGGTATTAHAGQSVFSRHPAPDNAALRMNDKSLGEMSVMLDASQSILQKLDLDKREDPSLANVLRRLQAMTQISVALGAVDSREQLMLTVMDYIFDIFPKAESAFVLLKDRDLDELVPVAHRSRSTDKHDSEDVAISRTVVNQVITNKQAILSVDAQGDKRFESQESILDLSLRSLMCAPLLVSDDVLGLIQVHSTSDPQTFDQSDLEVLTGVCAQAAIAVRNAQLYSEIEELFESFIRASVQAIEARDPVTAGHSFRVAEYTERLAAAVDRSGESALKKVEFDADMMRELRYAALLHDFGKVGVREHVLTKPKKLYPHQLQLIKQRFQYARASLERRAYKKLIQLHEQGSLEDKELLELRRATEEALVTERERLDRFLELILKTNEPSVSRREVPTELSELLSYSFPGEDGEEISILEDFEFSDLTAAQGSLSPDERLQIESHVSHTFAFLSLIPWSGTLKAVPEIAYAHHEKLNGSGYPRGLMAEEIPIQSKIMTIADIYDALTAGDRPYKRGLPEEQALDILHQEVASGKIDQDLVRTFIQSKGYTVIQ